MSKYDKTWPARKVDWMDDKPEDSQISNNDIFSAGLVTSLAKHANQSLHHGANNGHEMEFKPSLGGYEVILSCSRCHRTGWIKLGNDGAVTSHTGALSMSCQISNSGRTISGDMRLGEIKKQVMLLGKGHGHLMLEGFPTLETRFLWCKNCLARVTITRVNADDVQLDTAFFEKPCPNSP